MGSMSVYVMQMLYVCVLCASSGSSQRHTQGRARFYDIPRVGIQFNDMPGS